MVISTLPSDPPLHIGSVITALVILTPPLSLNVIEVSVKQPFASLTVTV